MKLLENSLNWKKGDFEKIKDEGLPVVIFGAGIVGEVLFHACYDAEIKVDSFADNNLNKTRDVKCGTKIIHTPDLKNRYKDANFLISSADIKDVVEQLNSLGFSRWYASNYLLQNFDSSKHNFSAPRDFVEYAVDTCILCHNSYLTPDKLFLRSADLIITEKCSLKCVSCSNLMQYYQKPMNCNDDEIKKSIDSFCNVVDEVNEFRIIGGEPFMNKDFDLIIKRLVDEPKIRKIVPYTNGTIVPKDKKIKSLKNDKTLVLITDYGKLSGNLNNLTKKLSDNDISFYVQKAQGWTDCGKIIKHNRKSEEQKEIFQKCCAKNTITISNGKLYRCPFVANASRLKAVPNYENDYIDLLKNSDPPLDIYEMKNKIKKYLLEKDFLETCDYCNGRSFGDPEIQPAIQTKKPLEYEKY